MKNLIKYLDPVRNHEVNKVILQITGVLIALFLLIESAQAQTNIITDFKLSNSSLEEALEALKGRTSIDLVFNHELIKGAPKVSVDIDSASVDLALSKILEGTEFTYKKINSTMVITPVEKDDKPAPGLKQTLRGQVIDQDSKAPLPFATVQVLDEVFVKGATTDIDGYFRIDGLPIGRYQVKVSFVGYNEVSLTEVVLGSGKETILNIELVESLTSLGEVVITTKNGEMLNEMAVVSGKSFDAEETKRYAASLSDPARMVQTFAGVASTDDISNEIVIRGNSPNWLLWKLEGVEIPSPNHFAEEGYSSGAISILSSNVLGTSDFYTGAFAADYGNALSGVFDLRLRAGNNQEYEHTFQAGILGFDIASEGPIKKGYSGSYLFNYRYSTLSLLNNLNIEVSENALPNYQDLSYKINLPTKNAGTFSIWGIGGVSDVVEKYMPDSTSEYYEDSYSDNTKTGMNAAGLTHTYYPDNQSYFETVLSSSESYSSQDYETLGSVGKLEDNFYDNLQKRSNRISSYYHRKYNPRLSMRYGLILSQLNYDYTTREVSEETGEWINYVNDREGTTYMFQGYVSAKYRFSESLVGTVGLHNTYFKLNSDVSIEPRFGLSKTLDNQQKLTFSYGLHSRHENLPVYFAEFKDQNNDIHLLNKDLDLTRAHHFVLGYSNMLKEHLFFKTEVYYQHIENLPVSVNPNDYWAPIFGGVDFEDTLTNRGKARNYGLELTLQKFFSDQYYFMITSSLFDSKYRPMDQKWYNSRYNINYVNNFVAGKEWNLTRDRLLGLNAKVIWSGGKRQLPIDLGASRLEGETVYVENSTWSDKTQDYIRIDVGVKMHFFKKGKEHVISLDIQNATNRTNTWTQFYDPEQDKIIDYPMAGMIPLINYRLEF